jgi:hypothetical protein
MYCRKYTNDISNYGNLAVTPGVHTWDNRRVEVGI